MNVHDIERLAIELGGQVVQSQWRETLKTARLIEVAVKLVQKRAEQAILEDGLT